MPDASDRAATDTLPAAIAPAGDAGTDHPEAVAPEPGADPEGFLIVARVLRPHGVYGEVSCEIITEFPQRFGRTKRVFLTPARSSGRLEPLAGAEPKPFAVSASRLVQYRGHPEVLLTLETVADRDAADALRGWLVQVPESESWRLPRGRFYWHQIIGLRVVTAEGEEIGTVTDILETGANDVYVVKVDGRERLIPAIKDVVTEIAPERGEMVVSLLPGL
jgi:16S rRNA processing protein RimM